MIYSNKVSYLGGNPLGRKELGVDSPGLAIFEDQERWILQRLLIQSQLIRIHSIAATSKSLCKGPGFPARTSSLSLLPIPNSWPTKTKIEMQLIFLQLREILALNEADSPFLIGKKSV